MNCVQLRKGQKIKGIYIQWMEPERQESHVSFSVESAMNWTGGKLKKGECNVWVYVSMYVSKP